MDKTIVLIVGAPGSGRTTKAKQIQQEHGGVIIGLDSIFETILVKDGVEEIVNLYKRDCEGEAVRVNVMKAGKAIELGISPVIVDAPNINEHMRTSYTSLATIFEYEIELVEPDTHWKDDADECHKRTKSGKNVAYIKDLIFRKNLNK